MKPSRPARLTVLAVAGLVPLLVVWAIARPPGDRRERAWARLARATAGQRLTDGRLSGAFDHVSKTRVAASVPPELTRAALDLASDTAAADDAEALHIRGVIRLLLGQLDAAVDTLRHASEADPTDAAILNDRAVAHLERGARSGSGRDLVEAYELADEALRIAPGSPQAAFNRALAVDRLGLRTDAAVAWKDVLERDASSPWADEAAGNLRNLAHPTQQMRWDAEVQRFETAAAAGDAAAVRAIATHYAQQVRSHFENAMVSAWAKSESAGNARDSARALAALRVVADALRTTTANAIPQRTVAVIDISTPGRRAALARGHLAYGDAFSLYRKLDFRAAERALASAQEQLDDSGSPFALLALFYRASSRSSNHDFNGALALLEQCERRLRTAGLADTPLHGHVHWVRGRSLLNRGFPYESLISFRKALAVFERNREVESVASVHGLLAWNYEFLGDEERAWSHYIRALHTLGGAHPRRERVVLHDTADFATNRGRSRAALLYASAYVRLVQAGDDVSETAGALVERSRAWRAVGDAGRARADLEEARRLEARVTDPGLRDYLQASLAVAEAEALETTPGAFAAFDRAVELVERAGLKTVLPRVWIARARAARALGRNDEAERSLRAAIALVEEQRATVADRDLQIGFAEEWYRAFDAIIEVLVEQGRPAEALAFAERSRARVLLEQATSKPGGERTISVEAIAARIPDGVAMVVYGLLERSSAVWVVRRDSIAVERLRSSRAGLARLVGQWEAARGTEEEERRALGALYDAAVRPVAKHFRAKERLIFAPDKALQVVPFAALHDRLRGRWLIEDHTIGVVPSLELFVAALSRDRELARLGRDRILVVGDPAFDAEQFPDFPRLPFAATEARRVAAQYGGTEVLIGRDATRDRVLERASGMPVIHLAVHAAVNSIHPSHSALLLAPDSTGRGALYAFEVDRSTFASTRLLVLGACRTAGSRSSDYEGPLGLARSFLATGVPTVVSTLWDIDDAASSALLLSFHRRLRAGDDAQTALRHAQRESLTDPDPARRRIAAWAAFQITGGFFEN